MTMLSAALATSCGGGAPGGAAGPSTSLPVLTTVSVSLSADTILVGQAVTAVATGMDQRGAAISVGAPTWSTGSSTRSGGGPAARVRIEPTAVIAVWLELEADGRKAGTEFRNELGERIRKKADELKPVVDEYTGRSQMPVT